jgi:hypothetical protein
LNGAQHERRMIVPKPLWGPRRVLQKFGQQQVKPLTIAAGFFFSKGIVLCADSQYTAVGSTKTVGAKIFHRTFAFPSGSSSLAVAFSGSVDYARMAIDELWADVATISESEFSGETVRSVLSERLRTFYTQHFYPHPYYGRNGPSLEFLIALRSHTTQKLSLFRSSETAVVELPQFGAVGIGTLLSDYLIPISYHHAKMSLKDVTAIAVHILYQTKRYVDGCGGTSEFLVLHDDGTVGTIDRLDITLGEQFSDFYDHVLRNIFLEASDGQASDADLRSAVEHLYTSLQVHRDRVRQEKSMWEDVMKALSGKTTPID